MLSGLEDQLHQSGKTEVGKPDDDTDGRTHNKNDAGVFDNRLEVGPVGLFDLALVLKQPSLESCEKNLFCAIGFFNRNIVGKEYRSDRKHYSGDAYAKQNNERRIVPDAAVDTGQRSVVDIGSGGVADEQQHHNHIDNTEHELSDGGLFGFERSHCADSADNGGNECEEEPCRFVHVDTVGDLGAESKLGSGQLESTLCAGDVDYSEEQKHYDSDRKGDGENAAR